MLSRKEIVAQDIGYQGKHLVLLVDFLPGRHATKPVVDPIPYKFGLVGAWLKLRRFSWVSSGAMAVSALLMPNLFPLRNHRRVLEQCRRDLWRWIPWGFRFRGSRRCRLSHGISR